MQWWTDVKGCFQRQLWQVRDPNIRFFVDRFHIQITIFLLSPFGWFHIIITKTLMTLKTLEHISKSRDSQILHIWWNSNWSQNVSSNNLISNAIIIVVTSTTTVYHSYQDSDQWDCGEVPREDGPGYQKRWGLGHLELQANYKVSPWVNQQRWLQMQKLVFEHIFEPLQYKPFWHRQYLEDITTVAKGFLSLGLQPHHSVCILGFNSPEWSLIIVSIIIIVDNMKVITIIII